MNSPTTEDLLNGDPEDDDGSPVLATPSREVEPYMDATPVAIEYLGARGEDA